MEMETMVKGGAAVAFTIDGPRGPRYVAKKGPVMLAATYRHPNHCVLRSRGEGLGLEDLGHHAHS